MKLCIISDVHGSSSWQNIVDYEFENVDHFIFLGDYFDDKSGISDAEMQIDNFLSIVDFADDYGTVDLLIGNHDLQYIGGARCSDFDSAISSSLQDDLIELIRNKKIKVCIQYGNYLFSHAGISKEWMKEKSVYNLSDINERFYQNLLIVDFVNKFNNDISGNDSYQSPLWIRPDALIKTAIPNICQVVGHSRIKEISTIENENRKIILTDTQLKQYLIIDTDLCSEQIKKSDSI